jgi:hypothetical protein
MDVRPNRYPNTRRPGIRRLLGSALCGSLLALLAAIPTGSAVAAPVAPSTATIPVVEALPAGGIEQVLSRLPVGTLNVPELSGVLSKLPALKGLTTSELEQSLTTILNGLPAGATLPDLTDPGLLGSTSLKTLETTLGGLLGGLLGNSALGKVETSTLLGALGAQTPSELADSLASADPSQLLSELSNGLSPATLQPLLESLLGTDMTSGFTLATVGEVAKTLGTSVTSLSEAVDLPATTMALTAPLTDGKLLTVLDGPEGLKATTLEVKEIVKEGGSGGKETSTTGSDTTGTDGSTLVVDMPAAAVTPTPTSAPAKSAVKPLAKIKILSHKVKGRVATLVIQVPAAGKLEISGRGVKSVEKQADGSERLSVTTLLTKGATTSLRKHDDRMKVVIDARFKPVAGASSSAQTTAHFV